ncbi:MULTISPECIES: 2Fe-2S iron-sulfur cluster-binding protein [Cyanophyceae]|uniref:2Fe-2S iron-sulfur cluster-binding protein n=1 Tax=Cyanophyceae TaxID=3028117 RepID=UPI0013574257|nr:MULTISPECIES: 2Fe-2S iron-sulfur cluster-binding protein [Cyanophyceae]NMG60893.1 2Fe-2S iron-sulfur cluster binding domain-containing protein [Geitlerinema sp. P-1104]
MSNTYRVTLHHQGETYTIEVPESETILKVAHDQDIELPSSCYAGVCTTCAAKILEGEVSQEDGMGVSPELQAEGYALLCVSYPKSDLVIETEKENEVYQQQFGQS